METFDSASNLYDCALAETVMDSLDFDYGPDVQWYCIQCVLISPRSCHS
jgi:hypothetical protein